MSVAHDPRDGPWTMEKAPFPLKLDPGALVAPRR